VGQQEETKMRGILLAIIVTMTTSLFGITPSSAMAINGQAISAATDHSGQIVQVRGGCGRGWHRGPYGGCRRN
jgi:hypothetical protein